MWSKSTPNSQGFSIQIISGRRCNKGFSGNLFMALEYRLILVDYGIGIVLSCEQSSS